MSDQLARDLEVLAELFRSGGWRELRIESAEIDVLFSLDTRTVPLGGDTAEASEPQRGQVVSQSAPLPPTQSAPTVQNSIDPAWLPVLAPNLGTFYRSPKPGADPFVEVGERVGADTEICLLEVMKLFTSVKAGVAGQIVSIAAADAELVEGGQVLFYIETD